jgi:hypothetical protein
MTDILRFSLSTSCCPFMTRTIRGDSCWNRALERFGDVVRGELRQLPKPRAQFKPHPFSFGTSCCHPMASLTQFGNNPKKRVLLHSAPRSNHRLRTLKMAFEFRKAEPPRNYFRELDNSLSTFLTYHILHRTPELH